MILTCASCATRYFAEDSSVGAEGRTVRCAACGHSWFVAPHLVLSQPADGPAPATFVDGGAAPEGGGLTREQIERARKASQPPLSTAAMARQRQAERQKQQKLKQSAIAWGAAGGALALSAILGVALRQDVARIWPQSASAYAAIGMPVNITGLEFSRIDVSKTYDGPTPMIVVSGAVRNISTKVKAPPAIRFSLRDENGEELVHWISELPGEKLQPGTARPFRSTFDSPPQAAADLEARFATAKELTAESEPHPRKPAAEPKGEHVVETEGGHGGPEGGPEELLQPLMEPGTLSGPNDGLAPRLPAETVPIRRGGDRG